MMSTFTLLFLVSALAAGAEVNGVERLSFCAGGDMKLECLYGRQITSLNVSIYSSATSNGCKGRDDLQKRRDLCRDERPSVEKERLRELIESNCMKASECFVRLPDQIDSLSDCAGKAYFYGIQIDVACSAAGLRLASSKIYRRAISRSNSRDQQDTSYNQHDKKSHFDNSMQHGHRGTQQSRESKHSRGQDLYKSRENNYNSIEDKQSKGNSRNDDNSNEYTRGGNGRVNGGKGRSSGKYGSGGYSASGSQIGSGAEQAATVTTSMLLAFSALVLCL